MFIATLASALGLIVVANAKREWHAIAGIVITSFSCGLGESSLMTYAPNFNKYVFFVPNSIDLPFDSFYHLKKCYIDLVIGDGSRWDYWCLNVCVFIEFGFLS